MMNKILVLFAHPALERSRINISMIKDADRLPGVTFHDLYQLYPDFFINVQREQELLLEHDIIVFHHPLYWYSIPPLLKQWIDVVLEHDWAYGSRGTYLRGKKLVTVATAGAGVSAYLPTGSNRYTINQFMFPIEQTARLCGMHYLPPFMVHATSAMTADDALNSRKDYHKLLDKLNTLEYDPATFREMSYLNTWVNCTYQNAD